MPDLTFPDQLDRVRDSLRAQSDRLHAVAAIYAEAIGRRRAGSASTPTVTPALPSRKMVIRMGALTGFHPILQVGLTTSPTSRSQRDSPLPDLGKGRRSRKKKLLQEFDVAPGEPLLVISATGQTQAAVDIAQAWLKRYPDNPLIVLVLGRTV